MVIINGYTVTPNHRQNRRRERPGSRTRRTVTRKSNIQAEFIEGYQNAYDADVFLPSDRTRPSPLLRESFHNSWQRWKDREAEEKAIEEIERMQLEQEQAEQQRLYGGEISDDELYRMGILYDNNVNNDEDSSLDKIISCEIPLEQTFPMFTLRHRKIKRSRRRRSTWASLPLYLSLSNLKDDADIARLLSSSTTTINTPAPAPAIQHHQSKQDHDPPTEISMDTLPQSLPASPALESSVRISTSLLSDNNDYANEDWEFITHTISTPYTQSTSTSPRTTPHPTTPSSDPETWILLSDDS